MNNDEKDPFVEAARAPARLRYGGAALFVFAAIVGVSTIRACREPANKKPTPAIPAVIESEKPGN